MSIPASIQASVAIGRGAHYEGELPLKLLPRLLEQVVSAGEPLKVALETGREAGYPAVRGSIRGSLELRCQRCDKPFRWTLDAVVNLRLVSTEAQEKESMGACDPYRVQEDSLPLRELVEDEVLLALPMLARCESCENSVNSITATPAEASHKGPQRENPFAALKGSLKH